MDITNRAVLERALASTYKDGERQLDDYRAVERAAQTKGETMTDVAERRGFPKEKAWSWNQGEYTPFSVKAIEKADQRGWLDMEWTEPPFTGLNVLTAWIFAGGSVNRLYEPGWTVRQRQHTPLETAFYEADIKVKAVHERAESRTAEYRPDGEGTLVGHFLVALGAPQGEKARQLISLPPYLREAPYMTRLDFARAYVYHRGALRRDKPTSPVQIREERDVGYIDELADFFRGVIGNPDWVRRSADEMLLLRRRGAAMLCADPLFGEWL